MDIRKFRQMNQADIESIDILKDAAALSIYGVRSANDVVLIKTKKETSGTRTKVSLDAFTGKSSVWRLFKGIAFHC